MAATLIPADPLARVARLASTMPRDVWRWSDADLRDGAAALYAAEAAMPKPWQRAETFIDAISTELCAGKQAGELNARMAAAIESGDETEIGRIVLRAFLVHAERALQRVIDEE